MLSLNNAGGSCEHSEGGFALASIRGLAELKEHLQQVWPGIVYKHVSGGAIQEERQV